jgi:hypothetical protein
MTPTDSRRTYWIIVGILVAISLATLILAVLAWTWTRLRSADALRDPEIASPIPPTPTAIPTLAGTNQELLICQRDVGLAMNARQMVGAANLSDDRLLRLRWMSMDWAVSDLDDALPGVILGLDVALEVWEEGCPLYDRVQIKVYDRASIEEDGRRQERQVHRLTVQADMDDLFQWQAGALSDSALLERLQVTEPGERETRGD